MKGLLFILCGLIFLASIRVIDPNPAPMLIDGAMLVQAADDRFCDVPAYRAPVLRSPQHKADHRLGRPFNDRGRA